MTLAFPQFPESYWTNSTKLPSFPQLEQHTRADVVVVGGGIAGITAAYLLVQEGLSVVLLEAGKLLHGTTGHTTAKVTAQHDLIYADLLEQAGEEKASLYYQANANALSFVRETLAKLKIDSGFSTQDAYIYTNAADSLPKLDKEMEAYSRLGIKSSYVEQIPLNMPVKGAIIMHDQGQFHPLHYLSSLVHAFTEAGGSIYEYTTAVDVDHDDETKVITRAGQQIGCKYVVSCTHYPFYDGMGFYFARMHAERSYVLGIHTESNEYPGGMYLSAEEPKRSIRYVETDDHSKLILIGGQKHKTGQGICTFNHYEELRSFAERHFQIRDIAYRWSAQDLITGDTLPYIGRITASTPNVYIATGFRKWGMTNGTAAALLIRDIITDKDNPYEELYSPSRSVSMTGVKNLIADNLDVAKHLIAGKLEMVYRQPEDLANDEGAVVNIHGKRAGAYRDEKGELHLVDTTCTHLGCEVEWNDGDRTWDCPCHGSRFGIDGEVMEGPAEDPLKPVLL